MSKRTTYKSSCGCEYLSNKDPAVKRGYELGGYLITPCDKHKRPTQTPQ